MFESLFCPDGMKTRGLCLSQIFDLYAGVLVQPILMAPAIYIHAWVRKHSTIDGVIIISCPHTFQSLKFNITCILRFTYVTVVLHITINYQYSMAARQITLMCYIIVYNIATLGRSVGIYV